MWFCYFLFLFNYLKSYHGQQTLSCLGHDLSLTLLLFKLLSILGFPMGEYLHYIHIVFVYEFLKSFELKKIESKVFSSKIHIFVYFELKISVIMHLSNIY